MPMAARVHGVDELPARNGHRSERQQHREHVPAVAGIVARRQAFGGEEVVAREALEVAMREALARAAPGVEVGELLQPQARRDVGEVVLGARVLDVARAVGQPLDAVEAQLLDHRGLALVVHHQRAAFDGGHVLVGMEAERHQVPGGAHGLASGARADGERGVLEHAHAVSLGERQELRGIDGSVEVRRKQQPRARRHGRLRRGEIDVARGEVHVDEDRGGAHRSITLPVTKKLCAGVMTSSPGPMPAMRNPTSIAAVADVSVRTSRPPT